MAAPAAAAAAKAVAAAPWLPALQRALQANAHLRHSVYMQLATVRADGRPAVRTVVFRGLSAGRPTFVTDARSRKMAEIAASPWAEVAWYFPDSREQFRLLGTLSVVGAAGASAADQQARADAWRAMSPPGRQQFTWPAAGEPRAPAAAFEAPAPGPDDPVSDNFCLVLLDVEEVDHVTLAPSERTTYRREPGGSGGDGGWQVASINP